MRFLLVDRILEYEPGKAIQGIKNVTMSDDFLEDHFPRFPVMPGVLQLEALVQLASWLVWITKDRKFKGILKQFGVIKFKDIIKPGDQLILDVTFSKVEKEELIFSGSVRVGGEVKTTLKDGVLNFIPLEEIEDSENTKEFFEYITGKKPKGILD
ncbi:MAG: 3-hydroxyacyl-ACP dehydratase FabZ family protein [Thermodesulfobacteriota bacterium]|nr:3-hydroxyacyl-ACP dehydratase FabZ family protein [Thermodesulfobacteriota bacterium]